MFNLYEARGFKITQVCADSEFEMMADSLRPAHLDIAAKGVHVPEAERSIRLLKEDFRTTLHGLPFQHIPRLMVRSLLLSVVRLRNLFPNSNSVDKLNSPASIVIGTHPPHMKDFPLEFGTHVMCHDNNAVTNNMESRGTASIHCIQLTGVGHGFSCLLRLGIELSATDGRFYPSTIPL